MLAPPNRATRNRRENGAGLHRWIVLLLLLVAGTGCGGDQSVDDYVQALNAMSNDFSPRGEANYLEFMGKPEPTMDDLRALLGANVALRIDIQDALEALEAPDQIQELNDSWVGWHARFLAAAEAQSARAESATSWEEFLSSSEFVEWGAAMQQGAVLCSDFEAKLNSSEAEDLFAETAWMPSELTEVVHAAIGCESFPNDFDDLAAAVYGR